MPPSTVRLYYTEPWLRVFEARVLETAQIEGRQHVWLDRTAFYPTSGGQPFDTGTINQAHVVDVVDADDGRVVHVVEGAVAAGEAVACVIDWTRRFDHMQQHTGQHILSAAFEHQVGVRTESFRLGSEASTIDLAREVSARDIEIAEYESNRIVWEGRPVSIRFVNGDEAARLPLRREPVRGGRLRLIDIEGHDLSACGGTHVSRTGEVGLVAVRASERFRGGTRVEFVCGGRALASYRHWRGATEGAARLLSVAPADVPAAVERLQRDLKDAHHVNKRLAEKAAALEAATLADRARAIGDAAVLVDALDEYDVSALKRMAGSFVREPSRLAVLFTTVAPLQVIAVRSRDLTRVDCAAIVTSLAGRFGGRGGGKPEAAQGGGFDATPAILGEAALEIVQGMLSGA